ncbi:hypothetical protein ID866_4802 [Astraeus odoratus]|nr:hypothetical protein ID866_4802 [Astraeus odoratus]
MAAEAQLHVDIQLLEEDSHKVSRVTDYHGRRLKDTVDINLIMKWIHFCKTEHGDQCESVWWTANDDDPPDFVRMIDVKQMALVRAPPRCRYVALSYVWGGGGEEYWTTMSNVTTRNRPAGLDKSVLPATILDAIDLVKRIRLIKFETWI